MTKHIKITINDFLNENILNDETKPEYYLRHYMDDDIFTSINHKTHLETKYTSNQYKDLFMFWYNKIKPFLEKNDEGGVFNVLLDWDEETLAKFDMYSLIKNYFKK